MNYFPKTKTYPKTVQASSGNSKSLGLINPTPRKYTIPELIELGNTFHREKNLEQAESVFRKVLEHQVDHPAALHFLGVIAHQSGQLEAAAKLISKAVKVAPEYAQAFNNLGNVYEAMGDPEAAIGAYRSALEQNEDYVDALFNLGIVLRQANELHEAEEVFLRCVELDPRRADAQYEIGQTYQKLGKRTEAQIAYRVALSLDPDHTDARLNIGNILTTLGRVEEAIEEFDIALEKAPEHIKLINSKGVAQRKIGLFKESLETSRKAEELDPDNIETLNTLGAAYQTLGENQQAADCYWRALRIMPEAECAHKCLLFVALNMPDISSQELFDIHREIRGHFDKPAMTAKSFPDRDRDPNRRIKIGYLSSDLRTHVVAMNVLPVIANHNHINFEVFLYGQVEYPDDVTKQFEHFADHWRSTMLMSNEAVAQMIEEDDIDILVTLAGRFDENRPIVASFRPAPVQVSFHDCATSGLQAMDYYLTDDILHAEDTAELFTEELYRLPHYYQYPIQDGLPEIPNAPALEKGFITFGCFNKPEKISEPVFKLWAQVLNSIPNSKLLMKYFNHYSQPSMQERVVSRFEKYGIGIDRLILKSGMDNRQNHLEHYHDVDICLDPFPFNGATTTFESLSMGVPVVAFLGRHFVDRVAASIVTHAGYPEFVAETKEDYVKLAQSLADDPDALNEMRLGMRDKLHASKLCDGEPYAHNVEAAFRDMWHTWCETGGYKGR